MKRTSWCLHLDCYICNARRNWLLLRIGNDVDLIQTDAVVHENNYSHSHVCWEAHVRSPGIVAWVGRGDATCPINWAVAFGR